MGSARPRAEDVNHLVPEPLEHVRDESPMTAPPDRLGAHDGGPQGSAQVHQLGEALRKRLGLQVVGVASEGRVAPRSVQGVDVRPPASPQARKPDVLEAATHQGGLESGAPELRHSPGTRVAADVRHGLDPMLVEQVEKFGFGAGGVSDGPDAEILLSGVQLRGRSGFPPGARRCS